MKSILIIGATRNLGKALFLHYCKRPNTKIYATARFGKPFHHAPNVHWISGVDISSEQDVRRMVLNLGSEVVFDIVYVVASASKGLYATETLDSLKIEKEIQMYRTSAIGPLLLVQQLVREQLVLRESKIILLGHEAGSTSLTAKGGDYGFHGSQAALNMIGKQLGLDLAESGIAVGIVYPGEIILEGLDRHNIHAANAVSSASAAEALIDFTENYFDMERTGQLWASRGFESVSALQTTMRDQTQPENTPVQLPW